jgi:hypothetical protein
VATSASCYHVEEDIRIFAIVEAVLEFREIQWQIFLAHVVDVPTTPRFNSDQNDSTLFGVIPPLT